MEDVPDSLTYNMCDSVFFVQPHSKCIVCVGPSVKCENKMLDFKSKQKKGSHSEF